MTLGIFSIMIKAMEQAEIQTLLTKLCILFNVIIFLPSIFLMQYPVKDPTFHLVPCLYGFLHSVMVLRDFDTFEAHCELILQTYFKVFYYIPTIFLMLCIWGNENMTCPSKDTLQSGFWCHY